MDFAGKIAQKNKKNDTNYTYFSKFVDNRGKVW